jgi:hypothetical protein
LPIYDYVGRYGLGKGTVVILTFWDYQSEQHVHEPSGSEELNDSFVHTAEGAPVIDVPLMCIESFEEMGLKPDLLRGIYAYGYVLTSTEVRCTFLRNLYRLERPHAVEQRAIFPVIEGRDLIVQAQAVIDKSTILPICVLQQVSGNYSLELSDVLIMYRARHVCGRHSGSRPYHES